MNEKTMNQTIPALAELNKVEGFSPEQYAREISDNDGANKRMYLDVKWRIMWFRPKYPNGKITTNAAKLTDNYAVVEARVYCDKNDPADNYISKGIAHRELDAGNPRFGSRFVESAETAAIGRALALGGFGLQFCCDVNGDETDIVDAPIESGVFGKQTNNAENQAITENTSSPETGEEPDLPFETGTLTEMPPAPVTANTANKISAPVGLMVNTPNTASKPNQTTLQSAQNDVQYTKSTPIAEIYRVMRLDDAKKYTVDFGKFAGKTIEQIAADKLSNLEWYINSYGGKDNILRTAAKIVHEVKTNERLAG